MDLVIIMLPFIVCYIWFKIHFNKIDWDNIKKWEYIWFWPWIYKYERIWKILKDYEKNNKLKSRYYEKIIKK